VQLACDIGDRRLLKSELPEQAFRYLDNQLISVLFFGFSLSPHISTILPNISATMVVARALRFLFRIRLDLAAIVCWKSSNRCTILSLFIGDAPALEGSTLNLQVRIVS
jgi:hypothetical protein